MIETARLRWRKVLTWGLLSAAGIGAIVFVAVMWPQWTQASPSERPDRSIAETAAKLRRLDEKTIVVPAEVLRALAIRTAEVPAQRDNRVRSLMPLTGSLALDANLLVRVHTRFAGEVVKLGTLNDDPKGRPLRHGDPVKENQLLAVVWSKDLGEKKSELVDAISRLRIDQGVLDRLEAAYREGATSEKSVRDAEKTVEGDRISVARAERTLRSWRLNDDEIKLVRAEADRISLKEPEDKKAHEQWARVEVCAPQAGVLLEKNVSVGDIVDTSADLYKVANLKRLAVWVHAYEEDLPTLQQFTGPIPWTIRVATQPGVEHRGQVEQISSILDPNQHTALVSGQVDNSAGLLRAGQFVTATIEIPASEYEIEVPTSAVVEDGRESILFVQPDKNKPEFERRRVSVARRLQDVVYLHTSHTGRNGDKLETVKPGDRVVSGGAVLLNEAMSDLPVPTN